MRKATVVTRFEELTNMDPFLVFLDIMLVVGMIKTHYLVPELEGRTGNRSWSQSIDQQGYSTSTLQVPRVEGDSAIRDRFCDVTARDPMKTARDISVLPKH